MSDRKPENIRNIALTGHGDTGKTVLTDALLYEAGVADRIGSIEDGTTQSDYTPEEQDRENSIHPGLFHYTYDDHHVNLIDLPGYPDFIGHAHAGIFAADLIGVCVNPGAGVMINTRKVWEIAEQQDKPRFILVNQIDQENLNLQELLDEIQEAFGEGAVPYNYPDGSGEDVGTVFSLLEGLDEAPPEVQDQLAADREELIETAVETDEELMEKYFADEDLSSDELNRGIQEAMLAGDVHPVLFTSAREEIGLSELQEFILEAGPSPLEAPTPDAYVMKKIESDQEEEAEEEEEETDEEDEPDEVQYEKEETEVIVGSDEPFLGSVFRIVSDPFIGTVNYVRIFTGSVQSEEGTLEIAGNNETYETGKLFLPFGEENEEVSDAGPGDIIGITEIEDGEIGDTIRDPSSDLILEDMDLPDPMVGLAVKPKSKGDEQRLSSSLKTLSKVDPTFKSERDEETNELIIRGLSTLHLEVILDRLKDRFDVEVETKPPRIPYRETITKSADAQYRHKKQSGGRGQYAEVHLEIEPLPRGEGFEFINSIRGASIPTKFIPSVEKGVQNTMDEGIKAGYKITDVSVDVYDGDDHPVDSSEEAFKRAASQAFKEAFSKAGPTLLEPIVRMNVTAPRDYMGDITGDLNSRRGKIEGMESKGDQQTIRALVPLSEVITYEPQLRSLTGGEGVYDLEFSHYEQVPKSKQEEIVEKAREEEEE